MNIAFFASSLVSSYWNGAATYYRGIVRALHERGHTVDFYEPDAYGRQQHRDLDDPEWARVVVYEPERWREALEQAADADVVVKTSGVGVNDAELEAGGLPTGAATRGSGKGRGGEKGGYPWVSASLKKKKTTEARCSSR